MNSVALPSRAPAPAMPWFRSRPGTAVVVASVLFVGVFVLRLSVGGENDAINMLYALPVSLLALAFGLRAGLGSGLLAVGLVAAWALILDVDLSVIGWASRVVPLLMLGILLGDASDRVQAANARTRALEAVAQRHQDAVEINDTLVQGMVAAKWALEAGRHESGLNTLTETIGLGHELVSKLMRDADMGPTATRPTRPRV